MLPLGASRASGVVLEIGPDDLRMDEAEAAELLGAAGLDLPDDRIAELTEQTEGWSAGLYLAALSLRARAHRVKGATTFSGSDRLVSEYLRSELLEHLSAVDRRFLTRTAVLKRLSGPLCDAVLEEASSGAVLESLAGSNRFLMPLDASGEWYRYHHLFQELLRLELAEAEPDVAPSLLARASAWCEANGQPEAAVAYAQEGGDVDRMARLVERYCLPTYQAGRVTTAERWLDWLEAEGALDRNAAVAVLGALLATVRGRPAHAERWAEAAERATYDGTLPDGSASIDSWLALLRAQRCPWGVTRMGEDAELAARTLARASPFRPNAMLLVAVSHLLTGEIDQGDDLLADVAEEGPEVGNPESAAVALAERAAVAIGRGRWLEAEELADRALRLTRHSGLEEYPLSALGYALAARVALHRGEQTSPASISLERNAFDRDSRTRCHTYPVQVRLELARAYLAIADAGGVETMLREIGALLRRQPDLGTLVPDVEEVRLSLETMRMTAPGASTLTEAELRLLPHLSTHLSFREIGERLYLSRHTVKSHAMAVYRKLNVNSRSAAVERADELGLL